MRTREKNKNCEVDAHLQQFQNWKLELALLYKLFCFSPGTQLSQLRRWNFCFWSSISFWTFHEHRNWKPKVCIAEATLKTDVPCPEQTKLVTVILKDFRRCGDWLVKNQKSLQQMRKINASTIQAQVFIFGAIADVPSVRTHSQLTSSTKWTFR